MNTPEATNPNTDPVYVILGATGGIGSEVCRRLAAKGARLVIGARGEDRLRDLAAQLDAQAFSLDATQAELVDQCLARAVEMYGRVDGVANCVGSLLLKPAHLTSDDEWAATLATNLTSAFYTVRYAARAMMKTGGSIVLSSSVAARVGMSNHEAIAASKAGVAGLVLSAAATYSARGIRYINGRAFSWCGRYADDLRQRYRFYGWAWKGEQRGERDIAVLSYQINLIHIDAADRVLFCHQCRDKISKGQPYSLRKGQVHCNTCVCHESEPLKEAA